MTINQKYPVVMSDGSIVEAVFYGTGTLCVSTQVGCRVGCPFCLSGGGGLFRDLSCEEMVRQWRTAVENGFDVKRLTLSGVGEPLHNMVQVLDFMNYCRELELGVSLTTTGGPLEHLEVMLDRDHNGLMLSLHAGTPATHRQLVPGGPCFESLWQVLSCRLGRMSRRRKRKIGINYLLLEGVNDSNDELNNLLALLEPHPELTLHLLGCNPVSGSTFSSPSAHRFDKAYDFLRLRFANTRRNNRWRRQSWGGCGTLLAGPDLSSRPLQDTHSY